MRLFFSISTGLHRRLADELEAAGAEIACIQTVHLDRAALAKSYPKSLIVGGHSELLNPDWERPEGAQLTVADVALLAEHYATLMHLMGRLVIHDRMTQIDKDEYLRRILLHMKAIVAAARIDTAIFWNEPHQVSHYLLYLLLRRSGGRVFIIQKTALLDHYCLIREIAGAPLTNGLSAQARAEISAAVARNIADKTGAAQVLDPRVSAKLAAVAKKSKIGAPYNIMINSLKRRRKSLGLASLKWSAEQRASHNARALGVRTQIARSWRNHRAYKRFAETTIPETTATGPRVFLSLQCQPERQTVPASFPFYNQIAVLQLLAQQAGEVWVKEHPSQFAPYQRNYLGRSVAFFDAIARMPNVTLLHHSVDTFQAIDRCDAVAVLAGTVGWEAMLRGKPTFVFGAPWFADAPAHNLIRMRSAADLERIARGDVDIEASESRAEAVRSWCAERMFPYKATAGAEGADLVSTMMAAARPV